MAHVALVTARVADWYCTVLYCTVLYCTRVADWYPGSCTAQMAASVARLVELLRAGPGVDTVLPGHNGVM